VSGEFAQRALALAAAGLLAGVGALAISERGSSSGPQRLLPQPAAASDGRWYEARAGVRSVPVRGRRSTCGGLVERSTLGVAHPVLPCGAKLYLAYRGRRALIQVVERGPLRAGRQFDLTPALATALKLEGVQPIRWTFARS
jgi:hypothetical protein